MLRCLWVIFMLMAAQYAIGHGLVGKRDNPDRVIHFPDTPQYKTLVLDLHTHSVFSDGHVWPTIRVSEAERDGLDGVAITEHLEWQPHLTDIPHPDRNRSFMEAVRAAKNVDVLVIPGVEITRTGDAGHINAVFVQDANRLVRQRLESTHLAEHIFETRGDAEAFSISISAGYRGAHEIVLDNKKVWLPFADEATYFTLIAYSHANVLSPRDALLEAKDQGAFVFWNHPGFASPDADLNEFHASAVETGLLHGVEIANGNRYYPNAHRLAMENNLALIGTSDVHGLIAWDYELANNEHRPVTLVLTEHKTEESIKEALFARRTVVWWQESLIGRKAELTALLGASISVESAAYRGQNTLRVGLRNDSDAELLLRNQSAFKLRRHADVIRLMPNAVTTLDLILAERAEKVELSFTVLNALQGPGEPVTVKVPVALALE